jgi:acyl phosphate:glycerol-3-phosphate acyltransferase
MILFFALSILAYLFGSISFAVLAAKIFRFPDPRYAGSHNPGATNVLRLASKKAAFFVVFCDGAKGILPIILAKYLGLPLFLQGMIALCAVLGHIFPIYYRFVGGKGIATTLGVLLGLNISLGCAAALTWLVMAALFRYSSLASIVMMLMLPGFIHWLNKPALMPSMLLLTGVVLICHRGNIKRLLCGKESKIGQKKI